MLRGEFTRGDGLVIPNNITTYGAGLILDMAMRDAANPLWVGLVRGFPRKDGLKSDFAESTFTNGYARKQILRSNVGWPTVGTLNGMSFLESDWLTWAAVGGPFSETFNRMMMCVEQNSLAGSYICLSAPLPAPYAITPATPLEQRQFKYKIYLG